MTKHIFPSQKIKPLVLSVLTSSRLVESTTSFTDPPVTQGRTRHLLASTHQRNVCKDVVGSSDNTQSTVGQAALDYIHKGLPFVAVSSVPQIPCEASAIRSTLTPLPCRLCGKFPCRPNNLLDAEDWGFTLREHKTGRKDGEEHGVRSNISCRIRVQTDVLSLCAKCHKNPEPTQGEDTVREEKTRDKHEHAYTQKNKRAML
ncbi:hypothetical protein ACQKWADRAFT_291447, partial [Trichoderma austrokoningii]